MLLKSSLLLEASPTVSAVMSTPTFSWAYPSCGAGCSCTVCFRICPCPLMVRLVWTGSVYGRISLLTGQHFAHCLLLPVLFVVLPCLK